MQLQGPEPELARVRVRLARHRALCGLDERVGRFVRELFGRRPLELGEELDGLVEVVRADLDELLARALGEPLREPGVVLRPRDLREAGVGDLPDERMLEAVAVSPEIEERGSWRRNSRCRRSSSNAS